MKRIEYDRYGGPEVMRLAEFEPATPGAGELRIRVRAAAINPVDWKVRNGDMAMMTGRRFPRAMGLEFSGVVQSMGPGVQRLKIGDEVFGTVPMKASGAFADVLVTKEALVCRKPAGLSFAEAACLCVAPVTAWRGLHDKARIRSGQRVFVAGCCGAVGRAAVQLGLDRGALVAGSCGPADAELARSMGVDPVFDYTDADLSTRLGRFDVCFDTAGKLSVAQGLSLLAPGPGVLLDINFTPARMLRGLLSRRYRVLMGTQSADVLEKVADAAARGVLRIVVGRQVPLAQSIGLIADLEQGRKGRGRAVITMD